MEILYSSGIRSNELRSLKIKNVDLIGEMIRIDEAKFGKQYERVIPISSSACHWIKRYIKEVRIQNVKKTSVHLFINKEGEEYERNTIWRIVKNHINKTSLKNKKISTHSFRVSCATEMLKRGANIKIVQEMLGHRKIESTSRYLRLVPTDLKKNHKKYHPSEIKSPRKKCS